MLVLPVLADKHKALPHIEDNFNNIIILFVLAIKRL